jgi:hypothetical protein
MTAVSHPEEGRPGPAGARLADPAEPVAVPAGSHRDRLRSPALQGWLAFLIYLAVWLATAFRPIVGHAGQTLLDQRSQDPNFYIWSLRWWPYAIGHALNPLYSHQIAAPAGHSLAWVTTVPPLALLATPLTLLAGPVVSFNILAAIALPVSGWAAFLLCRRLTGQFWPALVGGAVFGFSAYEMNHGGAGQLNLVYCLLLPILAYLVVVWREGGISSRTFVILAGLTMALQFYLFLETFADMTALLAVSLILGFALAGREGRPAILRMAKVCAVAYAVAIVLAAPYLAYALTTQPPKPAKVTGMDLASLVIPRPGRTFGIPWLTHAAALPNHISAACYVGVPLLALAGLLAVVSWQDRLVRFLSCMLAFLIVASIGPVVYMEGRRSGVVPWAQAFHLPLVRNAYPLRLMLFAYLVLAVAAALWLAGSGKQVPWARWPLAVLVVAFIALDSVPIKVSPHTTVPTFVSAAQYRHELSPGEIVVVVSTVGNAGMLWQAQSDFYMRVAGGYINAGLNHRTDLPRPVQNLANATPAYVAQFETYVKANHVGAILLDARAEPKWVGIFRKVGLVGHTVGDVVVYPTNGCQSCHALDWAALGKTAPAAA